MTYWLTVATFSLIYGSLAVSYNLSVGYIGLLSIAHAAFFSIGAYVYGYIAAGQGDGSVFLLSAVAGAIASAAVAAGLGAIVTMLSSHYVMIGTFALQMIFTSLIINLTGITGGVVGLAGIPAPVIFSVEFSSSVLAFALAAGLALATFTVASVLLYSPFGLRARATREDPVAASAIGINVRRLQIAFFSIGAALASVAGSVYAGTIGFIDPSIFTLHASVLILSMVVVGGIGNPLGVFLGGITIATLPAIVQEFDIGAVYAAPLQQMLFGMIMIVMVVVRPSGLFPETLLRRTSEASR